MLIGSHYRSAFQPRVKYGAGAFVHLGHNWRDAGRRKNRTVGESPQAKAAVPQGYLAPHAWLLPVTSGGLSASSFDAAGALTAAAAGGRNGEAVLAGSSDLAGAGQLISSAVATLTGSGQITDANALAFLNAVATLAGSGDVAGAIDALGWGLADLEGSGALAVTARADGELGAAIELTDGQTLTASSIAAAVWSDPAGAFLLAVSRNRVVTDPAAGTYTVYDDDDVTPLYTADIWQDAAGTVPYAGSGVERRDRLA
jgi:hypothetical protein